MYVTRHQAELTKVPIHLNKTEQCQSVSKAKYSTDKDTVTK